MRVIRAEEPESEENTTQRARDIDPRLADITLQLNKLRYRHFTLMTLQQRQVQLMKRELITLPGGHSVNLRPIYLENNRVGMWIRWQDPSGAPVLDTRMHFSCGQTLVAGTESGDFAVDADPKSKSAMILAIDAKPQK